jgi:hypothetical protein
MKFRNPWIDPRVVQVRSAAAQAYLRAHGWTLLPAEQPNLLPFRGASGGDGSPTVHVPLLEQARDYPQRIIELVTDLALAEGRYAVDVLNDILRHATAEAESGNGPNRSGRAEPAAR